MKHITYDREHDLLWLHKGFDSDEAFDGNMVVGDLVLDMSTRKRVRGIEVFNASKFFGEFGVTEDILDNLAGAELSASVQPDGIVIGVVFKACNKEIPAKIAVPLKV